MASSGNNNKTQQAFQPVTSYYYIDTNEARLKQDQVYCQLSDPPEGLLVQRGVSLTSRALNESTTNPHSSHNTRFSVNCYC